MKFKTKMSLKNIIIFFSLFFLSLIFNPIFSQTYHDFGFVKDYSIQVKDSIGDDYNFAWVGGMNSMQFCPIDLNLDGTKDMLAFEKHGNKILTFINNGTPDSIDYFYAPEYAYKFPYLYSWVKLADYNCDGLQDIFTMSVAGMRVFKNISDSIGDLQFVLVTPLLNSLQGPNYTNLLLTYEDYPGISDVDGDGDLDILTFYGLGTYLQYHKNMSMEKYGNCEKLDYHLSENCWGYFAESETSNLVYLNQPCWPVKSNSPVNKPATNSKTPKHTGSTMLFIDLDNDNDKDLILGDVDFSILVELINGGTPDSAYIISQDTAFPSYSVPVDLVSFPVPCLIDVNNDSLKDLLISPFDGSHYNKASNFENILYYKNTGSDTIPVFTYQKNDFFQGDMIDVGAASMPVLFDYDNDGLKDLFVGNYGYIDSSYMSIDGFLTSLFRGQIALFKNTGTSTQPKFQLITRDFANVSALKISHVRPTFGDIDSDGDADMFIGDFDGTIHYFENNAGAGNPMNLVLSQLNYQGINVGRYSTPELIDLDRDSLLDLVIGEQRTLWYDTFNTQVAKKGNLNFYKNTGTANIPVFTLVTDSLGGVDATDKYENYYDGYSTPCFFEDSLGNYRLFVGSGAGHIVYYKDIDSNLTGTFRVDSSLYYVDNRDSINYSTLFYIFSDTIPKYIKEGFRSAPAVDDLNNDGYLDLIVGNFSGGLTFYKGVTPPDKNIGIKEDYKIPEFTFNLYPNPAKDNITIMLSEVPSNTNVLIQIFDIVGNCVLTKELQNSNTSTFNVNEYSNGIYICRISSLSNKKTSFYSSCKKFIVNH